MTDLLSKTLVRGLGLASLTKDAIRKTAEDLMAKHSLSEEEGERLIKDLHRRSAKAQQTMEKSVEGAVNKMLRHLNMELVHSRPKAAKPAAKLRRGGVAKKVAKAKA